MDSGTNRSWTAEITRRLHESKHFAFLSSPHVRSLSSFSADVLGWQRINETAALAHALCLWAVSQLFFSVSRCWGYSPTGDLFINNSPLVTSKRTRGTKKREVFVCRRPLQQFEINGNYVYLYVCVCRRCTWIIVVLRCTGVLYETGRYARDAHKFGRQRALRPPIWERE